MAIALWSNLGVKSIVGAVPSGLIDDRFSFGQNVPPFLLGSRLAQTDSSGNFTLENVASGSYQITADKSGYGHDARQITIGDSTPEDVQFHLSPGDGITIRAVDTRDNSALTVNVLRVVDSQGNELPSQNGFFNSSEVVKLALAPGVYKVTVMARLYDDSLNPINDPDVKAFYQNKDAAPTSLVLRLAGSEKGIYRGEMPLMPGAPNRCYPCLR